MKKRHLLTTLSVVFLLLFTSCSGGEKRLKLGENLQPKMQNDNFLNFYHIFVGSFSDSDGDGLGDLQGVINRLDYLNDGDPSSGYSLGVNGIYLSPIHPSPSYHKYDVTNYMAIDQGFGDLATFDRLITEANKRGIKVIIDLVVNHTSYYHPWFREARQAIQAGDLSNAYIDYYTIVRPEERRAGHTYYKITDEYYYEGNFSSQMPEINPDSAAVKAEWAEIIAFWLARGVAGFRLDAVKYIDLTDQAASLAFWAWFKETAKALKEDVYIVGEVWSPETEIAPYYEYFSNFDFGMANSGGMINSTVTGLHTLPDYLRYLVSNRAQMTAFDKDAIMAPFLSNHDMDRAAGYLSVDQYKMHMAASLYQFSYGSSFIYYGEELGMKGSRGTSSTDANRRLAMLWGDRDKVKDPVGTTYDKALQTTMTVKKAKRDETSLYHHYKKIIAIKNAYPAIMRGEYTVLDFASNLVGGMLYRYQDEEVIVIHNVGDETATVTLETGEKMSVISALGQGNAEIKNKQLTVDGLTTVVLKRITV